MKLLYSCLFMCFFSNNMVEAQGIQKSEASGKGRLESKNVYVTKVDKRGLPVSKNYNKVFRNFTLDYYSYSFVTKSNSSSTLYLTFRPERSGIYKDDPFIQIGLIDDYGQKQLWIQDPASGEKYYPKYVLAAESYGRYPQQPVNYQPSSSDHMNRKFSIYNFSDPVQFRLEFEGLPSGIETFDIYYNSTVWFKGVQARSKKKSIDAWKILELEEQYSYAAIRMLNCDSNPINIRLGDSHAFYISGAYANKTDCQLASSSLTAAFPKRFENSTFNFILRHPDGRMYTAAIKASIDDVDCYTYGCKTTDE